MKFNDNRTAQVANLLHSVKKKLKVQKLNNMFNLAIRRFFLLAHSISLDFSIFFKNFSGFFGIFRNYLWDSLRFFPNFKDFSPFFKNFGGFPETSCGILREFQGFFQDFSGFSDSGCGIL